MRSINARAALAALSILSAPAWSHPEHVEPGLLSHWAAGAHDVENGHLEDVTHTHSATIMGEPRVEPRGPTLAAIFDGTNDYLLIADDFNTARNGLPTKEFTATAWVSFDELTQWGSILGVMQDNGNSEAGWTLGYNSQTFSFGLATTGADDGDGRMTYLKGKTTIEIGKWYHVAAVYDGTTMKLYVNGILDAHSTAQSGDILYPVKAPYALACYTDDDETYPLHGALHRVKLYNRALTEKELSEVVTKNSNLIAYQPPIPEQEKEIRWLVEPYLQYATLDSITVMSETNRSTGMTVEYGERQPLTGKSSVQKPAMIGEVKLTGLKPGTDYFYRVIRTDEQGNTLESPIRNCKTAMPADMPWSFGVIGDTQRNPEVTKACATIAFQRRPNFMLHCGDVVDDGYAKQQWLKDLFEPMKELLAHVPLYPTIGNHENDSHFYYDYFSLPTPEYYYTFTFGNAEFFMIDTNRPIDKNSEQYKWLERDLAKSTATWKFACHHHPAWSSDIDDYGDTQTGEPGKPQEWGQDNVRELVPLYEKYGIDIVFNGHIHTYERTWPILGMKINHQKGVRYITSGGGGGGLEEPAPNKAWFSVMVNKTHHVCYVAIHDKAIEFKAYDIEGRLFDTFQLTKP